MSHVSAEKLKKGYRLAVILGISFIGWLIGIAVIIEFLIKKMTNRIEPGYETYLIPILLGIAIISYYAAKVLRNKIISSPPEEQTGGSPAFISRLITLSIVSYALCETAEIVGVVFSVLTAKSIYMYTGILLALVLYRIYFPKFSEWEKWNQEINPLP